MRYRPIRRNNEFGRVYARGKSYVNQALVLYVLKTRGKRTRVGLTATKKIGHAVQRNRARRVMKAAIDEHLDYNIGGYDLVFVARGMTPRLKSWQLSSIVAKLFAQAGLGKQLCHDAAELPALEPRGHAPGHEYQIVTADVVIQMLVDGGLHHTAGAVALHGVADLLGGGQAHAGAFAAGLEHIQHQSLVHIGFAAGIHAAKFVVAADGTVAHCFGASFLFCPAPSRVHKADSLASISEFFRL